MIRISRALARVFIVAALAVALSAGPAAAQDGEYRGTLAPLNDSGASGDITVTVDGTTITITANVNNVDDLVHAQHLHGEFGFANECPGADLDEDGDGVISTVEGVPGYGTVKVSLTTEGETSEAYALAVESFPVASGGSYTYTRSFAVPDETAAGLGDLLFVVHGLDMDDSGAYDGDAVSSLSDDLPLEATMPIACASLAATGATPTGGVAAGGGGTATSGTATVGANTAQLLAVGLLVAGAGLATGATRRRNIAR